jgi:hypothetical protein
MAFKVMLRLLRDYTIDVGHVYRAELLPDVDEIITVNAAGTTTWRPSIRGARVQSAQPDEEYPIAAVEIIGSPRRRSV